METDKCKRPFSYRATLFVALSCVFLHNITHVALADTPTPTDTQQPPVAVAEKEQVTYRIQYIDEATGEPLARSITKIVFENDLVTEKAVRISGYELVSDSSQSLTARQNETIVFVYRKQDPQLLLTLRAEKMTQVDSLPHISAAEKDAYKMKIAHAQSVEEIDRLFRELKEKNDAAKVMITYRVKYVDATTNRDVTRTVSKLAFSGDRITEQASQVAGYELISDRTQSVVLTADRNQEIVFTYHKIDEQQFETTKQSAIEQVRQLKKLLSHEKNDYVTQIQQARTETDVAALLKKAQEADASAKVMVTYQIKFVEKGTNKEIAPTIKKLAFAGDTVTEQPQQIARYILPEQSKQRTLEAEANEPIIFEYEKTDEIKSIQEYLAEKIDIKKQLTYSTLDFSNRPEALKDYVVKSLYKYKLGIVFYATEKDVDKLYWDLWNKPVDGALVRIARNWTARDVVIEPVDTGIPGVNKYALGIIYHITPKQLLDSEDKIDEIIEKYDLKNKTDFEKAKFIYDYLIKTAAVNQDNKLGYSRYNHSAVLLANAGVCEGYAMAYSRIAERIGLETRFVSGLYYPEWDKKAQKRYFDNVLAKMDTEIFDKRLNHAWNQVKIDGKWYHVDSYHGDYYYSMNGNELTYATFLKSDKSIGINRIWNYNYTHEAPEDYQGDFKMSQDF